MKSVLIIVFALICIEGVSQKKERKKSATNDNDPSELYFDNTTMRYEDKEYKDYIKSVTFYQPGNPISGNLLSLNSNDRLVLDLTI